MKNIISIDIGSTFTKGILISYDEDRKSNCFQVSARYRIPTTVDELSKGFFEVYDRLSGKINELGYSADLTESERDNTELFYSSSAKGGLNIIALGIVPELTLKTAKITALSAGARISRHFSYKLTQKSIDQINTDNPDIILFTGGTDGGNEEIILHNARMLAKLTVKPVILYAGNQVVRDGVADILKDFSMVFSENVLPEIDHLNTGDARDKIREVFLRTIIHGKGLDKIAEKMGFLPNPTPYAVFEFVKKIPESVKSLKNLYGSVIRNSSGNRKIPNSESDATASKLPDCNQLFLKNLTYNWDDFCLIDMGGATTDFYSNHQDFIDEGQVIFKGLPEPRVKRTVEGDLGMRVSALSAAESGKDFIKEKLRDSNRGKLYSREEFSEYISMVSGNTGYISENGVEQKEAVFDSILASVCIRLAGIRHAGSYKKIYTVHGEKLVQTGKNLKNVSLIIGSGGYLANMDNFNPGDFLIFDTTIKENTGSEIYGEEIPLLPEKVDYFQDSGYLIPLVANIAQKYPLQSTELIMRNIRFKGNNGNKYNENPVK